MNSRPPVEIRAERADDAEPVDRLLDAAFSGPAEASLVDKMRRHGDIVLSLVATRADAVVGYAAWPRLWVDTGQAALKAIGLAPLAVTPTLQGQGIGSALVETGLVRLKDRNESLVFVLGDPGYYGRFGFSRDAARGYECDYASDHFMALKLAADAPKRGQVRYPAAFAALT